MFGQLLHKKQKPSYTKLFIGVESGYKTNTLIIRVRKDKNHVIQDLEIGDRIIFNGNNIKKLEKHNLISISSLNTHLNSAQFVILRWNPLHVMLIMIQQLSN